jgi:hypothetical protein
MTSVTPKALKARIATIAALSVFYPAAALGAALCATTMFGTMAHAAPASLTVPAVEAPVQTQTLAQADFQKKTYSLRGGITVEQRGSQTVIVFSEDFRTRSGPDLKVFLSRNDVASSTGTNATSQSIKLGVLKDNHGAQEYVLPEGVNIADFNSVLVHCEAFSKLWGGADI